MVDNRQIYEKHPELFHYTSSKGLVGILKSQTLWASHYRFLNDTSELQLMRIELGKRLFPFVREQIVKLYSQPGLKNKIAMKKAGGPIAIARHDAQLLADIFYRTAFEDSHSGAAIAIPYITSFCAHTSDQPYEQRNGLLSQWRGYAKGGFAIVFDTKKLCDLYRAEWEQYYYAAPCLLGDIVYQGDDTSFEEEFGETIDKVKYSLQSFRETGDMDVAEIYGDVLSMFTRLKHRGFYEEREVRSIAFPMTKEIEDQYKHVDSTYVPPRKPMKRILKRKDGVPYIELFDFEDKMSLPIRRIIVGPQRQQEKAKENIEHLIGSRRIDVHCSETPLTWPGEE